MIIPRERTGEDGVALIYVLLVVLIVGTAVAVAMAAALTEMRVVTSELQFEDTIHVAEAGAESLLDDIDTNSDFFNATSVPDCLPECDDAELRSWAAAEAALETHETVLLSEGEGVGLVHVGSNHVYGVGFVPSRVAVAADSPGSYTRVVRLRTDYPAIVVEGEYTVLADELLDVSGGGDTIFRGGVKSNVAIDPARIDWDVDRVEVVDGCLPSETMADCPANYVDADEKTPIDFHPDIDVDPNPNSIYASDTAERMVGNLSIPWYDYCPPTGWRLRDNFEEGDPDCSNDDAYGDIPAVVPFNGTRQTGDARGVFFLPNGEDVTLIGGNHQMTVITEGTVTLPNGNSVMNWGSAYPNLLLYAGSLDTNSAATGNPDYIGINGGGIVYSETDITLSGNADSREIAWIAGGTFALRGGGSGEFIIEGNIGPVDPGVPPRAVVAEWQEFGR